MVIRPLGAEFILSVASAGGAGMLMFGGLSILDSTLGLNLLFSLLGGVVMYGLFLIFFNKLLGSLPYFSTEKI